MVGSSPNQQRSYWLPLLANHQSPLPSPPSPSPSYDMGVDHHAHPPHYLHHNHHHQLQNQHSPFSPSHFPSPPPAPPLIPSAPNHKDILTTQPPPPPMLYSTQTTNSNYGGYQSQNISNRSPVVYVYELPYNIRKSICDLLGMIHYDSI